MQANSSARRVLLIGWDGADWKVASPLVDAGKMPNLQRLIEEGVMGNISTLYPVLSPMLWTSIATGKRAHQHGIHGFVEPDPRTGLVRPITNLGRKCKAIWNILGQSGKRCNVIGWWPSHPAEPINGVMVSNHFQTAVNRFEQPWPIRPGTVHPKALANQLSKFRVHPGEIDASQILPFVRQAADVDQQEDGRVAGIAKILAETSSVHAVATAVMQHEPWDFMGIYYDSIDHFSHGFMRFHPPREEWIDEQDFAIYHDVMNAAYQFHDMMLGTLLQLASDDTTVILLSDHGFHPDHLRPQVVGNEPAGAADEHRQFGMLVMKGTGIQRDELVFGASLLDIAPTILTLFDLPVGDDMDGRALITAFDCEPEPKSISSWEDVPGEDGRHPADAQVDPIDAHQSLKQLVDLGYVEEPDEDCELAMTNAIRELKYNLARDYFDANKIPEAIRELSALWDEFPDEGRFGVKLFNSYLVIGNSEMAEATLDRLVAEKLRYAKEAADELEQLTRAREERLGEEAQSANENEDLSSKAREQARDQDRDKRELQTMRKLARRAQMNPASLAYFRGCLLHAKGEYEQALAALQRAEGVQAHNRPSLMQKMGECLIGQKEWSQAIVQFREILDFDPVNAQAHMGLAQCQLGQNQPRQAYASATSALGLVYHNPKAHFLAGKALSMLRRGDQAISHLETALAQNHVFPECHRLLAEIFRRRGNHAKADEHYQFATAAQRRLDSFQDGNVLPDDADLQLDVALNESIGIGTIYQRNEDETNSPVIVVSGLPRSGTSMMMQMLAAGGIQLLTDDHRAADKSNPRGYFEYEPAKQLGRNNRWVANARGMAVKIVAQLLINLPVENRYRIIFMARPLSEILASQATMLDVLGREGASISKRRLAQTYKKQLERLTGVLERHAGVSAITVDYADAVANPSEVARRINKFLGGGLDLSAMAAVVDPAMRHQQH